MPPAARLYRPSSTLTQKGVSSSLPISEYELPLVRVQSRAHLWSNQRGQADGSRDRPGLVGTEFAALSEPHGRKRHFSSPSKGVLLPKGGRGCWVNKGWSPLISRTFQVMLRPRAMANIKAIMIKRPGPSCLDKTVRREESAITGCPLCESSCRAHTASSSFCNYISFIYGWGNRIRR